MLSSPVSPAQIAPHYYQLSDGVALSRDAFPHFPLVFIFRGFHPDPRSPHLFQRSPVLTRDDDLFNLLFTPFSTAPTRDNTLSCHCG